jgi:hypothetical protein
MKRHTIGAGIPTLEIALAEHMSAEDLRLLAALTGKKLPTRKVDLAAVLTRHLDGDGLQAAWQSLDEIQRAAVAEVVHSNSGKFLADRFRAKYGRDPLWFTTDASGYRRTPSPLGFFFYGAGEMPADLKQRLGAFVPRPSKAQITTLTELPVTYDDPRENRPRAAPLTVHCTEQTAQRELSSILRLVDAGKVAVSDKTRRASSTTIEAISNILEGGDFYPRLPVKNKWNDQNAGPIRAFGWPLVIQAGGLAQLSGSRLQLTTAGRKALAAPAAETIQKLWTKWLGTTIFDELSRIDCVKGQTGKGRHGLTGISPRRNAVARALSECPTGSWISTDEFFRFLRASGNGFSVTRSAWDLYIGELQYGSLGYGDGERILEERYLYCLLLEYAATLGLIDAALIPPSGARGDYRDMWGTDDLVYFSRYDGLMYIRLTPLGAYCLGAESDYQPASVEAKPVLRVLSTMEIAALGAELEQSDRITLDIWATRVSDQVWRLDAGTLLAAIAEGRSVVEIQQFLTARGAGPLPETVGRLLEDVANRSAKALDRGLARLIECADAALAALIANDSRTRKLCMQAGERCLVVPASSEAAFKRALREVGYIVSSEDMQPAKKRRAKPDADSARDAAET